MSGSTAPATPMLDPPVVGGGEHLDLPGAGLTLRATRWAAPGSERPPVLLLHGLASTRRFWDLVVPLLDGLELVAIDQRGHGDSPRPTGPYDSATVTADAEAVLSALGWGPALVVGHSWGAGTALRLAAAAPRRVCAVVALDGGIGSPWPAGVDRAQARARLTPPRTALPPEQLRARLADGPLSPWWDERRAAAVLPLFELGDDGLARARLPFAAHMAIVDDLLDAPPVALPDIGCPAWLVACERAGDDPRGRDRAAALERAGRELALPRLLRWAGAVHDVPLQWPWLVAGLVRAAADEAVQAVQLTGAGRSAGAGAGRETAA